MAKGIDRGVNGVARKVTSVERGISSVARNIVAGERGISGVARAFWPSGIPLSSYAEGDIVYIPENGTNVEFYVAKHNYESGLNGSGRTLLSRASSLGSAAWNSTSSAVNFENSTLATYLNGTYKPTFSEAVQTAMATTTFYRVGTSITVGTASLSIFIPSITEGGGTPTNSDSVAISGEGSKLPTWLRCYLGGNTWTRSIAGVAGSRFIYKATGFTSTMLIYGSQLSTSGNQIVPMFTLPSDTPFDPNTNVIAI